MVTSLLQGDFLTWYVKVCFYPLSGGAAVLLSSKPGLRLMSISKAQDRSPLSGSAVLNQGGKGRRILYPTGTQQLQLRRSAARAKAQAL